MLGAFLSSLQFIALGNKPQAHAILSHIWTDVCLGPSLVPLWDMRAREIDVNVLIFILLAVP